MREKLIDIILKAQGYKEVGTVAEYYKGVLQAELKARQVQAERVADALLAAGVIKEE